MPCLALIAELRLESVALALANHVFQGGSGDRSVDKEYGPRPIHGGNLNGSVINHRTPPCLTATQLVFGPFLLGDVLSEPDAPDDIVCLTQQRFDVGTVGATQNESS